MSTLISHFTTLMALLFPSYCAGCGEHLEGRAEWICVSCLSKIPTTGYHLQQNNKMLDRLREFIPSIANASAIYFYYADSPWSRIIHEFKYHHSWYMAHKLGEICGSMAAEGALYHDVDMIIPIPLHPRRRLFRGYNQAEEIAKGVAKHLGVNVNSGILHRSRHTITQVGSEPMQRWQNVDGAFSVKGSHRLAGRHVLLVDDVFTTGATMVSCAEALLAAEPSCKISVFTAAITPSGVSLRY